MYVSLPWVEGNYNRGIFISRLCNQDSEFGWCVSMHSIVRLKPLFWFRSDTKLKPKLADTFGQYYKRYQNCILKNVVTDSKGYFFITRPKLEIFFKYFWRFGFFFQAFKNFYVCEKHEKILNFFEKKVGSDTNTEIGPWFWYSIPKPGFGLTLINRKPIFPKNQ